MHALFSQFSGLIGLFVFLTRTWRHAPVEDAFLSGLGAALAVFLLVSLGDIGIRRILTQTSGPSSSPTAPPAEKTPTAGTPAPEFEAAGAYATAAA